MVQGQSPNRMKTPEQISRFHPCTEAELWIAASPATTPDELWSTCPNGDWMLWLVKRMAGPVNSESHRRFTYAKSRYPDDKRPRAAIEAAENYAGGKDYSDAAYAAYAAAYAAYAAYAAAYAAYAADAAAARTKMLAQCADEIRVVFPTFPKPQP